jgi:hypothetical protein
MLIASFNTFLKNQQPGCSTYLQEVIPDLHTGNFIITPRQRDDVTCNKRAPLAVSTPDDVEVGAQLRQQLRGSEGVSRPGVRL